MFNRAIVILSFAAAALLVMPSAAFANHCTSRFTTDIGPLMQPPSGGIQTVTRNCTGTPYCSDYFDIILAAGDRITIGFCAAGAVADFSPDIAIFRGTSSVSCNSSFTCGNGPHTTYAAPIAGTYRVRVGKNSSSSFGGVYTLAYTAPKSSEIVGSIPICFQIDAIDNQFAVINDGSTADFPVLNNDECDGDRPISVVTRPGDLLPDRGGVAITDGTDVIYTPASGFAGFEEFTYTARDAGLEGGDAAPSVDEDSARVVVNVLEDLFPDAVDDDVQVAQSTSVFIDVLANDSPGNEPNVLQVASNPPNGSAALQTDNTIRYFSASNFFGEDSFEYRLTDANGDSDVATVTVGVSFLQGRVPIDIMPNDAGNNLNLRSGPGAGFDVAILSDGEFFDAPGLIDPLSLKLGPRQANIWGSARIQDVDGDGDDDLVVKFLTQQTGIACGDTSVNLSGRTFASRSINGTDSVNTFNCPRIRKRH